MTQALVEGPKTGRPSAYKPEYIDLAYKFALLGADDARLAQYFDVTEQTINNWKQKHPDFFESLKRGKYEADANVSKSLYNRALGYSHDAVKIFSTPNGTVEHKYTEHYAPDTTAAIFWLKNRNPEMWRDVQDHRHSGSLTASININLNAPQQMNAIETDYEIVDVEPIES